MRRAPPPPALLACLGLLGCELGLHPVSPVDRTPRDIAADEPVCDTEELPPRTLRLLTRREYTHTIDDLFGWSAELAGDACETLADCAVETQSCAAGVCQPDPCTRVTFTLDGDGGAHGSVVVSGDFNGWAPTAAEGGLELAYLPGPDLYVGKLDVDTGTYAYKIVVDGDWWTDPSNPDTVDDGYGGRNSLLTLTCGDGEVGRVDWAAELPPETRPEHFPFDNHADAGLVTTPRAEALLDAGEVVAEAAVRDLSRTLGCDPSGGEACVRSWAAGVAPRAWRRPVSADEVDVLVDLVMDQGSLKDGVGLAIQVVLASPSFLYRSELGAEASDGSFRLDGYEVATALSYTLWETTPDDRLLAAAAAGELDTAEGVEEHARRMLADPRARRAVQTFTEQWLGVEKVLTIDKSDRLGGGFGPVVRQAMLDEVGATATYVVFDGSGRWDDLVTGTEYVQSAALTSFYGLEGAGGLVDAGSQGRAGVLGMGAVLTATAHSDQTSPVRRGLFVRERLLCQSLGTPPANAGGVPDVDPDATTRERFQQHSDDPACSGCHQYIDPVGFGFEHFDPVGRWRDTDDGAPIDAWGELMGVEGIGGSDVEDFATLHGLGALLTNSEAAPRCFTRQVWRFAVGRDADPRDCTVTRLSQRFARADHDVQTLILDLVTSPEFRSRR